MSSSGATTVRSVFASEQDMAVYANWLREYAGQFAVAIHAWVFMTNHVHLLATPYAVDGVSRMMQALGRRYVRYFNREYRRNGTLREGRFKSSLVQSETYLLLCQRYIELNPVRAAMVSEPAEYKWSSYQCHALGKPIALSTPHAEYLRLGSTPLDSQHAYRALFRAHVEGELLGGYPRGSQQGAGPGWERFKSEIEQLCGRRMRAVKMGRPTRQAGGGRREAGGGESLI